MFTSLSSVRAHHQRGAVRWDLVKGLAPGILVGGLLAGAGLFELLKGAWLALVFAVFVSFSGWQMLAKQAPSPQLARCPARAGQFGAGAGIGLLSGLVGAGGGFVSVPFMIWCNVSVHFAVATSAALGFPIAIANTLGYVVGGWGMAGATTRCLRLSLPARLGADRSRQRDDGTDRRSCCPCHERRAVEEGLRDAAVRARGLHALERPVRALAEGDGRQHNLVATATLRFVHCGFASGHQFLLARGRVREARHAHRNRQAQILGHSAQRSAPRIDGATAPCARVLWRARRRTAARRTVARRCGRQSPWPACWPATCGRRLRAAAAVRRRPGRLAAGQVSSAITTKANSAVLAGRQVDLAQQLVVKLRPHVEARDIVSARALMQFAADLLDGGLLLLDLGQCALQMRLAVAFLGALMPDRQHENPAPAPGG